MKEMRKVEISQKELQDAHELSKKSWHEIKKKIDDIKDLEQAVKDEMEIVIS